MNLETVNGCEIYYDDKWLNSNLEEYREKYLNGLNETITNMKNDLNKNIIKIINNGKY